MKRVLIIFTSAFVALSAFAYGYSYDSYGESTSNWLNFIGIVLLIWGVLEIILFFKIWKMTNDVDKLRASLVDDKASAITKMNLSQLASAIKRKYYLGKANEAYDDLNLFIYKQISLAEDIPLSPDGSGNEYLFVNVNGKTLKFKNHQEYIESVLNRAKPLYEAIGREMPDILKNLKYEDFQNFVIIEDHEK